MRIYILTFLAILLLSCSQKNGSILTDDALATQLLTINNNRDTVIKTANGALLQISQGSFSGNSEQTVLQVKEAYTINDIIGAGLTTQSDGKPLQTGGMIYVNTKEDGVALVKPIRISLPTDNYDVAMKLFKGEKQNGKMNWTAPQPLIDSLQDYLNDGKAIFNADCRTCHAYEKQTTGPAMKGLESRGPWANRKELFAFTRNCGGYIPTTCYTKNLAETYKQIMPSFPQLTDRDLDAVYDYIRNQDIKNGINLTNNYKKNPCDDSCYRYDSIRYGLQAKLAALNEERKALINSNENRVNYNRLDSTGTSRMNASADSGGVIEKVQPDNYKAVYYRFDITSLGWYNIDKLKELSEDEFINLKVHVDDSLSKEWDVFIAVPKEKMFDRGGLLDDKAYYGFYTYDGKAPLPAGLEVIVFALGEVDGQVAFDYSKTITTSNTIINLHPKLSTKEAFNAAVKKMVLPGVSINAADSKNADAIRKVDAIIKAGKDKAEAFRPKTCDCNCGMKSDSTQPAPSGEALYPR